MQKLSIDTRGPGLRIIIERVQASSANGESPRQPVLSSSSGAETGIDEEAECKELVVGNPLPEGNGLFRGEVFTENQFRVVCFCFAVALTRPGRSTVHGREMHEWFCASPTRQLAGVRILLSKAFNYDYWKTHPESPIVLSGRKEGSKGNGRSPTNYALNVEVYEPDPSSLPGVLSYLSKVTVRAYAAIVSALSSIKAVARRKPEMSCHLKPDAGLGCGRTTAGIC